MNLIELFCVCKNTLQTLETLSITLIRAPCTPLQHEEKPKARQARLAWLRLLRYDSRASQRVTWYNYLTVCWPAPAALHTNSRIFTGTPWLRNSDDNAPDDGNLWPSGPVEYGDDGRLWWYPGTGESQRGGVRTHWEEILKWVIRRGENEEINVFF